MFHKSRLIFFTILLLAGAFWIAAQWRTYKHIPKHYEWNALEAYLSNVAEDDDLLIFDPAWFVGYAQVHGRLQQHTVVKRNEIFTQAYPPSSKLWLIGVKEDSSLIRELGRRGFIPEIVQKINSIHLTRYAIPVRKNLLYDFNQNLAKGEAFIQLGDGLQRTAEWKKNTWVFKEDPQDWNQISVRPASFQRQGTWKCIWLHPIEEGIKTLRFREVPLGSRIEWMGGIANSGLGVPAGAPVYFSIEIDGISVAHFKIEDTAGKAHRLIDTTPFQGSRHQVTFSAQTPLQASRHLCFNAWSVRE